MKFKIGDQVKVIGQEIYGNILQVHLDTNEIVIEDQNSEYQVPDNELIYRPNELQFKRGGGR